MQSTQNFLTIRWKGQVTIQYTERNDKFGIIRFKSHYFEGGQGFQLKYESSNVSLWSYSSGACGGSFTTPNGILTSPLYPEKYNAMADCLYNISQPNGTYLNLSVLLFDLYTLFDDWCFDYLEVRDGKFETSPLIGKFCGSNMPASIQTTQNDVWMR